MLQGIPLLILLFLVFFGANILGLRIDPWTAAAVGYGLYGSAFLGEIWRGCLQAVPRGQRDAAVALALSFTQRLRLVVAPQAARIAVPPSVGFMVQLLKSTSLASVIGFTELTWTGQMINNVTFQPLIVFGMVAGHLFRAVLATVAAQHPAGTTPAASLINAAALPNFSQRVPGANELRAAPAVCILGTPGRQLTAPTLEETPC